MTKEILSNYPWIQLTLDLSHWVVVCERLLPDSLMQIFIAPTSHIHARIGHAQAPQIPCFSNSAFLNEIEYFESIWKKIWKINRDTSMTMEYGPFPYLPQGGIELNEIIRQQRKRICEFKS